MQFILSMSCPPPTTLKDNQPLKSAEMFGQRLPDDIIHEIAFFAVEVDQSAAYKMLQLAWRFQGSIIPRLYHSIIFVSDIPTSSSTYLSQFKLPHRQPPLTSLKKYGHHVRSLRLSVTQLALASTVLLCCPNVQNLSIDTVMPNARCITLPLAFFEKVSLKRFVGEFLEILPPNFVETKAFQSVTHLICNPWSGKRPFDRFASLTHLALDACIGEVEAREILAKCQKLQVLVIFPCFGGPRGVENLWRSWGMRVKDKRMVVMDIIRKQPLDVMQDAEMWRRAEEIVQHGWTMQRACWDRYF